MNTPDRRAFLKTTALGLGGISPLRSAFSAPPETCGLGIGTYGLQSLPLGEALASVAATGYDCVEITAFPGFTGDPKTLIGEGRKNIGKQLGDTGLRLSALMADLPPSADLATHRGQTESLLRLCELGRDLSPDRVPLVQTVLGGKDWDDDKGRLRDRLADWLQVCADQKIVLAIKPHRGNAMSRPADAIWLFEQLGGSPWLRMVYDYSHFHLREPAMSIPNTVAQSLPWTAYVASKDAVLRDGKVVFALTGEGGGFDHADIIVSFHNGGYRGDFCCEVSSQLWKAPGYDAAEALRICYRHLAAAFERAGVSRG